jgi:hypothetical protein
MGRIYEAIELGSGAMTYIPGYVNIGSGIQKLMWGGYCISQSYCV